ncbi:NAD(+) synthetase [Archaeoglobales archaeon]|nr:MAG: NAD(+) synthetase [Archaeoglobales archaeon]
MRAKWSEVEKRIVEFIKQRVNESKANGVVLGLSGGVDSSCVAFLCVKALGKDRVLGLIMPERGVTKEEDVNDAMEICKILGIEYRYIEINDILNTIIKKVGEGCKIAVANLKPRIRMILNYYYANELNRLVAGTGNKTELLIGYFTKYGDGGVDFLPIGDLYKTEVRELAKYLGVPERIINKTPTAGLWVGQTDEGEIGMSYNELDKILIAIEKNNTENIEKAELEKVLKMIEGSKHKREMPFIAFVRDLIET